MVCTAYGGPSVIKFVIGRMMMLGEWPIALELCDAVGDTNDCRSVVEMSLNEISNHQQRIEKVSHV